MPGFVVPLKVSARRRGSDVVVDSNFAFQPGKGLKVCYYLMKGTEHLATRWYSTESEAVFQDAPSGVRVRAYVRATGGSTTRSGSEMV